MSKFFDQPAWLQVALAVMSLVAIITISYVLIVVVRDLLRFLKDKTLKTSAITISPAGADQLPPSVKEQLQACEEDEDSEACASVEKAVEFVNLLLKQHHAIMSLWRIKDIEILREQMAYAEDRLDIVFVKMEKVFSDIMSASGKFDYMYSQEYLTFRMFLEVARGKIVDKFRSMCKDNHFNDKTDSEFKEYSQIHAQLMVDAVSYLIQTFFPFNSTINFSGIQQINPILQEYAIEVTYRARDIVRDKTKVMDRIQDEFDSECVRVLGHTIKGVIR